MCFSPLYQFRSYGNSKSTCEPSSPSYAFSPWDTCESSHSFQAKKKQANLTNSACVCSIVKTTIQVNVLKDPDSTRKDRYSIWNAIELYVGLLAASLPALRPLFKSMLDLRTRATASSNAQRHKYYMQEDGIGMNSLPGQGTRASKYNVRVTTRSQTTKQHFGRSTQNTQSEEDFASKGDADSLDDILPMQGREKGITKTVNVSVT